MKKDSDYQGYGQRYEKIHYGGSSRRRVSFYELMRYLNKPLNLTKAQDEKEIKADQR